MLTARKWFGVTSQEQNLLVRGMSEFRNLLLRSDRPTEDVDDLLLKIIDAPTRKPRWRDRDEAR